MSKITITILGTTAGAPTKERAHPSIYFTYDDGDEFSFLFDCGEGAQRQMMLSNLSIMNLDDVFITHWHGDHCLGLPGMVDTMGLESRKRPLSIYGPRAKKQLKRLFSFSQSIGKFKLDVRNVPYKGGRVTTVLDADRVKIVSTPVEHSIPTVAYALIEKDKVHIDPEKVAELGLPRASEFYKDIKKRGKIKIDGKRVLLEDVSTKQKGKKIVYSGDTELCENLRSLAHGADLLIQDCTYFESDGKKQYMHASLSEVAKMTQEENVKKTILTHVSRRHQNQRELEELVKENPNLEVAKDFMRVIV